jgi:small subunit ribosomal protein S18
MFRKKYKSSSRMKSVAENCIFCNTKTEPNYQDVNSLEKYVSERGKIIGKAKSGVCSKHQRAIGIEIKRARQIGMLPFIVRA